MSVQLLRQNGTGEEEKKGEDYRISAYLSYRGRNRLRLTRVIVLKDRETNNFAHGKFVVFQCSTNVSILSHYFVRGLKKNRRWNDIFI